MTFEIPDFDSLYHISEGLNLSIIGVEFIVHLDQVKKKSVPQWSIYNDISKNKWSYEESFITWSNISTAAYKQKNAKLWDLGGRISNQIRVCSWRLKELSNNYHNQLVATVDCNYENNVRFMDEYTWICYMTIQSFLIDACILRDYLAEYIADFIYQDIKSIKKITTMSGLIKHVLKKQEVKSHLFNELRRITNDNGWLKKLGDYRDLVMHSAPLFLAKERLFAIYKHIQIAGGYMPMICCPLPYNPKDIYTTRASEDFFKDIDLRINELFYSEDMKTPLVDGLEYCHKTLIDIVELSLKLAEFSPIEPEMMIFDESNILELKIE